MLRKIYQELVKIRKELQAINKNLESQNRIINIGVPNCRPYV